MPITELEYCCPGGVRPSHPSGERAIITRIIESARVSPLLFTGLALAGVVGAVILWKRLRGRSRSGVIVRNPSRRKSEGGRMVTLPSGIRGRVATHGPIGHGYVGGTTFLSTMSPKTAERLQRLTDTGQLEEVRKLKTARAAKNAYWVTTARDTVLHEAWTDDNHLVSEYVLNDGTILKKNSTYGGSPGDRVRSPVREWLSIPRRKA